MGMETTYRIGAYAEVVVRPMKSETFRLRCPEHGDVTSWYLPEGSTVCPRCANFLSREPEPKETWPSLYRIVSDEKYEDWLCSNGFEEVERRRSLLLTGNLDHASQLYLTNGHVEIRPAEIARCKTVFVEHYQELLDVISESPLVESVTVRFGVVKDVG